MEENCSVKKFYNTNLLNGHKPSRPS